MMDDSLSFRAGGLLGLPAPFSLASGEGGSDMITRSAHPLPKERSGDGSDTAPTFLL